MNENDVGASYINRHNVPMNLTGYNTYECRKCYETFNVYTYLSRKPKNDKWVTYVNDQEWREHTCKK